MEGLRGLPGSVRQIGDDVVEVDRTLGERAAAALTEIVYFGEQIRLVEGIGMLLVLLAILSLNLASSRK